MLTTLEEVERHCLLSPEERKLLQSPECPIVLLRWQRGLSNISPNVAPNLKYLEGYAPLYPPAPHPIALRGTTASYDQR